LSLSVKRFFVPIKGAQIHVRRVDPVGGPGAAVILLHPSPQSGTFSIPMALKLAAAGFTAFAVDLPGYGLSDPLVGGYPHHKKLPRDQGLDPYVAPYIQLLDALGLKTAAFYGNATGAELSHIIAHHHPERLAVTMLDTAGHNPDEELDKVTAGYFPDTTPTRDGGHLLTYWDMVRFLSIFAPWQFTDKSHRLPVDQPPADKVHDKLIEYLRAGQNYADAYRPAFYTAKGHLITRVKTPATLTRWEGKPDLTEVDELIKYGLPPNFTVIRAGRGMDERLDASVDYLVKNYKNAPAPAQPAQVDRAAKRMQKMWVDVPGGQMLARVCFAGSGRPILGLHDPAGSSKRLESTLAPYVGKRPVIALDNPSSGESDKLLTREEISTQAYARFAVAALDALGVKEVDVIGRYSGGQVAMDMSAARRGLVKHIAQVGVMIFDDAERADLLANYTPSIAPQWDGGHLIRAWSIIHDMSLFWPWYNRTKAGVIAKDAVIDGPSLHPRVEDLLKMGDAYQNAYAAAFTYPMAEKLKALKTPCLVADVPGSGTYNRVAMAKAAAPNLKTADLPDDQNQWPAVFDAFFMS
jgi:pimeloyl-ACP methyl ester carboxylesterase